MSQLYVYRGSNGDSLVTLHDALGDDGGGGAVPAGTVTVGERAAIEATLANDGEQVAAVEVVLTVDGNVSTVQSVEIPAGESRTVTFERAFGSPGEYAVGVEGANGTVPVVEAEQNESTADDSGSGNREDGGIGELLLLGSVGVLALVGAILGLSRWMEP